MKIQRIISIGVLIFLTNVLAAQEFTNYDISNSGLPDNYINGGVAIDQDNNKWFGTGAGVAKFDDVTWTVYTTNEGIIDDYITCIAVDANNNIWIGTDLGASKFDGTSWTSYTSADPEFDQIKQHYPNVAVKTALAGDLFNISGSPVHIGKAVMNLVSNAVESIEGRGRVTLATTNRYLDRPLSGYDDVAVGEYVVLSVSDDGLGISPDDLKRIFEPFYTKKVMGRSGTGLGLAVVWNILLDHKGYIDVLTRKKGTTFELYFPATREELAARELPTAVQSYKGSGQRILVVDDEPSQRDISCRMLEVLGYRTQATASGEDALAYLKAHTVDLVLLDMIMDPGLNGRETYEQIVQIHPGQKAIIISGFAETEDVLEAQRLGAGPYLKKPVTLEALALAVKKELEKQTS